MINITIKSGRLAAAPETRRINDKTMCRFRMAVYQGKDKETGEEREPLWLNCVAFDRLAEGVAKLSKGDLLTICGRDVMEYWYDSKTGEKRSSWRVTVTSFEYGGARNAVSEESARQDYPVLEDYAHGEKTEDDLPL